MEGAPRQQRNSYLDSPLPRLFAITATPIVAVFMVSALNTLIDAVLVGQYVGDEALTAVTLMFPLFMLLVAASTLVSSGFSSVFSRLNGAENNEEAAAAFGQALILSLFLSGLLIVLFLVSGRQLVSLLAGNAPDLESMGYVYASILFFGAPQNFLLALNIDVLRCTGLLAAMTTLSLSSAILNIVFDYLFIAVLNWGVAGSAYGTVLAQFVTLCAAIYFTIQSRPEIFSRICRPGTEYVQEIVSLGSVSSLGFLGIALTATLTLFCLQTWSIDSYAVTSGAFGVINRLMTFVYLPLLGIRIAFEAVLGNNYGAGCYVRTRNCTQLATAIAFVYCLSIEAMLLNSKDFIGLMFTDKRDMVAEVGRILPFFMLSFAIFGPAMMMVGYFHAIGDLKRSAILNLARNYLFAIPLLFVLPVWFGERGIWYAAFTTDLLLLILTSLVFRSYLTSNKGKYIWFRAGKEPKLKKAHVVPL